MAMDPITADFLSNVAASIAAKLIEYSGRRIRKAISGTEKERGLRRAIQAGIAAMVAEAEVSSRIEKDLLEDIFQRFFGDEEIQPDIAKEMLPLTKGQHIDVEALLDLFKEAGYDSDTLPGLNFESAVAAFETGFLTVVKETPDLREELKADVLLEQLSAQKESTRRLKEISDYLKSVNLDTVAVRVGQIIAENLKGAPVTYEWRPLESGSYGFDIARSYLEEVASEANILPWGRIFTEYADPKRGVEFGLEDVYTSLDTTELEHIEEETAYRKLMKSVSEGERKRISALKILNTYDRLLLMGDPGSGKSTFAKYVTYVLANSRLYHQSNWLEKLQGWEHGALLPVFVELRHLAAYARDNGIGQGNVALFRRYLKFHLDNDLGVGMYADVLIEVIRRNEGEVLFLLDGLDEVPTGQRQMMVDMVNDLWGHCRSHRYLVTCRPYAYIGQPWKLTGFREASLAPFDRDQIKSFVSNWYRQLERLNRLSKKEAAKGPESFMDQVEHLNLYGLAENPLLLTAMTHLHVTKHRLPEDRVGLYDEIVWLLFERWEGKIGEERILDRLKVPGLKSEGLMKGLSFVAFKAHSLQKDDEEEPRTADIPEESLSGWLAPYMGGSKDKADEFVDYIRERAGLLIRHKTEAYTFPHRSFQEFLAARYLATLTDEDLHEKAAQLANEDLDHWREVLVMLAGYLARQGRNTQAVSVVASLMPYAAEQMPENDRSWWIKGMVAAEGLIEIGLQGVMSAGNYTGKVTLERLREVLVRAVRKGDLLVPEERAESGNILARLGDPRPGVGLDENGLPDIEWSELIEPGPFIMGNTERTDPMAWKGEQPQFTCHLIKRPYKISKYPVTVAQYKAFVNNGGYKERKYWTESGWEWKEASGVEDPRSYGEPVDLDNHPRVGVSWYEAVAFTRWLSEKLGKDIRLPTEAQWERAARHTDGRRYPWSPDRDEKPDPNRANYDDTGLRGTSAVGIFPGGSAECGAEEMSGNVLEWCSTKWLENYEEYEKKVDDDLEGDDVRVLRGGSWISNVRLVRCAYRLRDLPGDRYLDLGFRVVCLPSHTSEC